MSDLVPIGTHPGSVNGLLNQDLVLAPAATTKYTISKLFLRCTDSSSGALTASIHNATGGGGDSLSCTIADQAYSGVSTGSAITVDSGEVVYLRLTAVGSVNRLNLSGWFEREGAPAVTALLCTLARVKTFLGESGSDNDDQLNDLIASVSAEIQSWLGYKIIQTTATGEKLTALLGSSKVVTRYRPIISISTVTEAGTSLTEDTDFECDETDKRIGRIVRISGGYPTSWNSNERRIVVTYDHGYASVPADIQQAACELVAFDFLQSNPGGKRFGKRGTILESGGTSEYATRAEVWAAQRPRLDAYARM